MNGQILHIYHILKYFYNNIYNYEKKKNYFVSTISKQFENHNKAYCNMNCIQCLKRLKRKKMLKDNTLNKKSEVKKRTK